MSRHSPTETQAQQNPTLQLATLGGGCFWCTEAAFEAIKGVVDVESGYAGSDDPRANYEAVCSGQTGLAEVAQVLFDPALINYEQILNVFFAVHNPTTLDQQGADRGTQYRSVIFTHSDEQDAIARSLIPSVAAAWDAPVVSEIVPINHYTRAEDYHQEYFKQNPNQGYCQTVISPKLAKLRANYAALLK
jgi:peptide-methionine (S)-S-oxide reductase